MGYARLLPDLSDEHCAEFYYQTTGTQENRDRFGMHFDRIIDRQNSVDRLGNAIVKPLTTGSMPALRISQENPDRVIEALEGGRHFYDVMNYRNLGQVRELPLDTVVETFINIDATGVHPAIANPLPKAAQSIVIPNAAREAMLMEAAVAWDASKLTAALCTDPLYPSEGRVQGYHGLQRPVPAQRHVRSWQRENKNYRRKGHSSGRPC